MTTVQTDFLVIGGGIAGLSFALHAAQFGSVAVLTKHDAFASASHEAQGGIAAALADGDSWLLHRDDTLTAGAGLCSPEVVELVVQSAAETIEQLAHLGVRFARNSNGRFALHREGGHSHTRIVYAGDYTGREIVRALVEALQQHSSVALYQHHTAIDLVVQHGNTSNRCVGAYVLNADSGHAFRFLAGTTVLCTGGAGQLYPYTSNPAVATGDGIALAYRAGAQMRHLEFVQFHPTALLRSGKQPFLISEALRGFGAKLKRADGSSFMEHYHRDGSLATRDVVARAIHTEQHQHAQTIVLDATAYSSHALREHFPTIYATCLAEGIDITRDVLPISPVAHYLCGGIATDVDGRTSVQSLYACGENACTGMHGANRLASNSLLEALVLSQRAARNAVSATHGVVEAAEVCFPPYVFSCFRGSSPTPRLLAMFRGDIQQMMWQYVGIRRTSAGLQYATEKSLGLLRTTEDLFFNYPLATATAELRNLALTAHLVALAALHRRNSVGTHLLDEPELCRCSTTTTEHRKAADSPAVNT